MKTKRFAKKTAADMGAKRGTALRSLRAIKAVVEELAANHPKLYGSLIDTWRVTTAYVDALGFAVLEHPSVVTPEDAAEMMLRPYDMMTYMIHYGLAQTLNYAEELELVETGKALENAWRKFLDAAAMRPHVAAADVAALRRAVEYLNQRVVGMYQGTASYEFDPPWAAAAKEASDALARILEGLAK